MAHDEAYLAAEKKIEKAKHLREKKLILQSFQLTEIPESLGHLTHLRSLDLANNKLTALPESLGNLKQLQSLNLSGNKLKTLPESLGQFMKLQWLGLSDNQLKELPHFFSNFTELQSLNLSQNKLSIFPESLSHLKKLHSLNLSSNELLTIPEWFGYLTKLQSLNLENNQLGSLPESFRHLIQLTSLNLSKNNLSIIPEWFGYLKELQSLNLEGNQLRVLPESFSQINCLHSLDLNNNKLTKLPISFGNLLLLAHLNLHNNKLTDIPDTLTRLINFDNVVYYNESIVKGNPLNLELVAAYKDGLDSVKAYLRAKAAAQITLNEAKLILIGEGEVGKSCLLGALRGDAWEEDRPTTHGIEIKPLKLTNPDTQTEITLNGWDFGGQRVYRPTHQLFFSAPAVYLVVWKPREGPQQGFVREWIKLVKHREPDTKILIVATHGGPQQRQPDIDRQELWDLFGRETVADFFFVDSKPDSQGHRKGIEELKLAIARLAAELPEMGRSVPKSFQDVREALQARSVPYLPLDEVFAICHAHNMDDEIARLFITISHRLGHLTHYPHDPALRDIVILRPDWLATAISYILDDESTRAAHGLVRFSRLAQLWDDPARAADSRYPTTLHPIFIRLMERFDLSYRVADSTPHGDSDPQSLIAQLVPDNRPENFTTAWISSPSTDDLQQTQICRIVDDKGNTATAEGLFYQLIVRLHKYSLGRAAYADSVHWQRGLVLDDDYNGRALLEHKGNDVHITVRAPYPERFLTMLTEEVKYLVESFWEGLRCNVMVPCIHPCGRNAPGTGLFQVEKLIKSKKNNPKYPCPVCDEWQDIDALLRNAPTAQPDAIIALFSEINEVKRGMAVIFRKIEDGQSESVERFDQLDANDQRLLSRVDDAFAGILRAFVDEVKEGPRLFSFAPVDRNAFNPKQWVSAKFQLTLWCEHSRKPLPVLNGVGSRKGVYEIELTRDWFRKAAPYLKVLTGTLSLVLPMALPGIKLALNDSAYKSIEENLEFSEGIIEASIDSGKKVSDWISRRDKTSFEQEKEIHADGATLRELHALLKAKDPGFGGLVRVMNKRQEFMWVHERFAGEY